MRRKRLLCGFFVILLLVSCLGLEVFAAEPAINITYKDKGDGTVEMAVRFKDMNMNAGFQISAKYDAGKYSFKSCSLSDDVRNKSVVLSGEDKYFNCSTSGVIKCAAVLSAENINNANWYSSNGVAFTAILNKIDPGATVSVGDFGLNKEENLVGGIEGGVAFPIASDMTGVDGAKLPSVTNVAEDIVAGIVSLDSNYVVNGDYIIIPKEISNAALIGKLSGAGAIDVTLAKAGGDYAGTGSIITDGVNTLIVIVPGDVNGDGEVAARDALQVLRCGVGNTSTINKPERRIAADIAGTVINEISARDALQILKYATGSRVAPLEVKLP